MALTTDQSCAVQEQIAKCLGLDVWRITRQANFFTDLGGTVAHLKPLQSGIEAAFGASIEPIISDINARIAINTEGKLTVESLQLIREYLPELYIPFEEVSFPSLFSVALIETMVAKACEEQGKPDIASFEPLAAEHVATLRQLIAEATHVPVEKLQPETNLFRDLDANALRLGLIFSEVKHEFDFDPGVVCDQITARLRVDAEGNVTPESMRQLEPVLSGIDYQSRPHASAEDLFTVGVIEELIARHLASRPADLPLQNVNSPKQKQWIEQLPQELGDRKLRLLLAGGCRLAFRDRPNPEPVVLQAIEAIEKFADTGKSKGELKEFQKACPEWKHWRQDLEYRALYQSLSPTDPEQAVTFVTGAIHAGLKITDLEALRELKKLYRDLLPQLNIPEDFVPEWRTPPVVELASSMYTSSDFTHMPKLAALLEQAGCQNPAVLGHCRDSQQMHIRGCWVVDAILNGSWAGTPKLSKSKKSRETASSSRADEGKSLLSQLPKRAQLDIANTMSEDAAQMPVEVWLEMSFCATREDLIARFDKYDPGSGAEQLDAELLQLESERPDLTEEQHLLLRAVRWLGWHIDIAVARRVTLQDPAELARGLYVGNRLEWLNGGGTQQACDTILNLFAVRDLAEVEYLANHTTYAVTQSPNDEYVLCSYATSLLIKRDFEGLRPVAERMQRKKVRGWMEHRFACLLGIADRRPDQIVAGLEGMLETYPKRRDDGAHSTFSVFNVETHGLYRLAEWISPDLVAGFDVTQAFPWDAEFHAWTQAHENPLEGVDLSRIAPILFDAIVHLRLPDWWVETPAAREAREQQMQAKRDLWLLDIGPTPDKVMQELGRLGVKLPPTFPAQIVSGVMSYLVKGWVWRLQRAGATVESRQ